MKRVFPLLLLGACSTVDRKPAPVVTDVKVVESKVRVPVFCDEKVVRPKFDLNSAKKSQKLEVKLHKVLRSEGQLRAYVKALEAAGLTCGVVIVAD